MQPEPFPPPGTTVVAVVSTRVACVHVFLPLLQVQVKAADNSINKEAREALVEGFSVALTSHIPSLEGDRCVFRQGLTTHSCCSTALSISRVGPFASWSSSQPCLGTVWCWATLACQGLSPPTTQHKQQMRQLQGHCVPDMAWQVASSCKQGQGLCLSNCIAVHGDRFTSVASCCCGCRIYVTFEELPVQNIAVGNSIMRFATMHTAKSAEHISGGHLGLEACSWAAEGCCENCSLPSSHNCVQKHALYVILDIRTVASRHVLTHVLPLPPYSLNAIASKLFLPALPCSVCGMQRFSPEGRGSAPRVSSAWLGGVCLCSYSAACGSS